MGQKSNHNTQRILIISGLAIAAFGLITEAIQYPWGALAGQEAIPDDPAPISEQWVTQSTAEDEAVYLAGGDTYGTADAADDLLQAGVIKIPTLGKADNVAEGDDANVLALCAGHIPGTALPGQPGNCAIVGLRSSDLLRHLELVGEEDPILLSDQEQQYTYTVFRSLTVEPTDVSVLDPIEGYDAVLTLITGTPYGSNKQRLVVQAELNAAEPLG